MSFIDKGSHTHTHTMVVLLPCGPTCAMLEQNRTPHVKGKGLELFVVVAVPLLCLHHGF